MTIVIFYLVNDVDFDDIVSISNDDRVNYNDHVCNVSFDIFSPVDFVYVNYFVSISNHYRIDYHHHAYHALLVRGIPSYVVKYKI